MNSESATGTAAQAATQAAAGATGQATGAAATTQAASGNQAQAAAVTPPATVVVRTDAELLAETNRLHAALQQSTTDMAAALQLVDDTRTRLAAETARATAAEARASTAEGQARTVDAAAASQVAAHGIRRDPVGSTLNPGTQQTDEALATEFCRLNGRAKSVFYAKHSDRLKLMAFAPAPFEPVTKTANN